MGHKEYVGNSGIITIDFYLFKASYEDQMDVEINIDRKLIDKDYLDYKIRKQTLGFDIELDGEIRKITGSLEVARFIAEMYGRIPGIFRECVQELWILDIDYLKWKSGN